jgi:peptide methionine sulfoxide reductase MsrB
VSKTSFVKDAKAVNGEIEFHDSNTGKLLFTAPRGRTMDQFLKESKAHGWPSFRDAEVNWDYVRCLPNGESVSVDGTHLGHNLPDKNGNRYCINLVSVAGKPM